MIPVLICLFKKSFVRMWSIAVVFVLVTLVGLLLRGIRVISNAILTKFLIFTLIS